MWYNNHRPFVVYIWSQAQNLVVESLTPLFCCVDGFIISRLYFLCHNFPKVSELNSNTRTIFRGNITDLDNTPYSHILECGSNPTGMPSQMGNSCMVFQFNPQANYSAQLAFSFGADKIAIRRKNGGDSWTDWKYFTAN